MATLRNPEFSMCDVCAQVAIKTPAVEVSAMFGTRNVVRWSTPVGWTAAGKESEICAAVDAAHDTARKQAGSALLAAALDPPLK